MARALEDLKKLYERVPFDEDIDSVFTYVIIALEVMRPDDGIAAARMRQAGLLDAVSGKKPSLPSGKAEAEAWHFLALLRAAGQTDAEKTERTLLLGAIAARTAPLSATDQYTAQRGRAAYEWLGREAPTIQVARSTYPPVITRRAPVTARATLLVVEMVDAADAPALSLAMDSLRSHLQPGTEARLVLIGTRPAPAKRTANPPSIRADYTNDALLETLSMESGPALVLLGADHRVRWVGTGAAAWLNPQQQAEILLSRTASQ
ncbi:hypothetical protein [Terriglobus roseus]|uniref:hypothetical protein n=1 Tax=Terriglobus roseus TaxID=392734 RepID=UPI0012F6EA4F|nr:hypothetical protein [Terriglobus roseus]